MRCSLNILVQSYFDNQEINMKIIFGLFVIAFLAVIVTSSPSDKCGENEQYFECESSSRELCECTDAVRFDCREGCQCKNGYCRVNGKCVKRTCTGSPYDAPKN
ncbi:hypothetical protein PVAND_017170 [Polypedilum vanderplanki]|uniref:TIL domain-containing protein n=1 Tax=Polypedilum vanderplanki TaxID=319348 RepID=A0A9J6BHY7_POLVA|nr:hypothetical protein PVAND_017170 [Polypedilum vanderplanki]